MSQLYSEVTCRKVPTVDERLALYELHYWPKYGDSLQWRHTKQNSTIKQYNSHDIVTTVQITDDWMTLIVSTLVS